MSSAIEEEVNRAALALAVEARELLGLPEDAARCQDGSWIKRLPFPPDALSFARIVTRHAPVLIGGCIQDRMCWQKWHSSRYVVDAMAERKVQVARTPNGRADDVHTHDKSGKECFVLPSEARMTFDHLFRALSQNHTSSSVVYLQSQNSNLTVEEDAQGEGSGDLSPLLQDVRTHTNGQETKAKSGSYAWADEALGYAPEATNLWIGTKESKTSMHRDHYENLFTVIRGTKIFTLYPPCEAHFLCEDQPFDVFQWQVDEEGAWSMQPTEYPPTPWIPIDPTEPKHSARNKRFPLFAKALPPLTVEVNEGETLYLPAGWFHHVGQRGDADGICICVNWWYDSEFAFSDRWALEKFVKKVGELARTR